MIKKEELKQILFFKNINAEILEKIKPAADIQNFKANQVLFRQNKELSSFYMVLKGKVLLNTTSPGGKILTLDEIIPGYSFGASAFLDNELSSFTAVCAEPSTIITLSSKKMKDLFKKEKDISYLILLQTAQFFKSRLVKHTRQFLHFLTNHPEIKKA
ncbi:MAG: hypothetical protein B6I26_05375 [Desulfobacteraceae bacterium 4572_130]|nr:MAG: hypothetical protein B6I26_05375 [Desulfobacteraceae bacterium 4572_130]